MYSLLTIHPAISIIFFPKANFFTIYISMQLDIVR